MLSLHNFFSSKLIKPISGVFLATTLFASSNVYAISTTEYVLILSSQAPVNKDGGSITDITVAFADHQVTGNDRGEGGHFCTTSKPDRKKISIISCELAGFVISEQGEAYPITLNTEFSNAISCGKAVSYTATFTSPINGEELSINYSVTAISVIDNFTSG